jgi:DNA (cytosine-5)-methyltransferase 1
VHELTHASFFSGVGGLDLGLGRAGRRTVSFSEIDPYASAVLAERWPGVPNLGDIVELSGEPLGVIGDEGRVQDAAIRESDGRNGWHDATLWTGGFPCQDLSVAGKRSGLAGSRSGLAFAFLELVGRHRPRFVLLENVPGLLSSHAGRDMATLIGALVELGYGVGYRILDARYFGVPQRRRRVFILGDSLGGRPGAERAAEVLSVGSRCRRHPPTGIETGPGVAAGAPRRADGPEYLRQSINAKWAKGYSGPAGDEHHNLTVVGAVRSNPYGDHIGDEGRLVVGAPPDPARMRATDGLARGLDDRDDVVGALGGSKERGGWRAGPDEAAAGQLVYNPYRTLNPDGSVTSGWAERPVVDALHGPTGNPRTTQE